MEHIFEVWYRKHSSNKAAVILSRVLRDVDGKSSGKNVICATTECGNESPNLDSEILLQNVSRFLAGISLGSHFEAEKMSTRRTYVKHV